MGGAVGDELGEWVGLLGEWVGLLGMCWGRGWGCWGWSVRRELYGRLGGERRVGERDRWREHDVLDVTLLCSHLHTHTHTHTHTIAGSLSHAHQSGADGVRLPDVGHVAGDPVHGTHGKPGSSSYDQQELPPPTEGAREDATAG